MIRFYEMKRQAFTVLCFIFLSNISISQTWEECNKQFDELYNGGGYGKALNVAQDCLLLAEKEFGKENKNYVTSVNGLASIFFQMGRYAEAESLFIQGMIIYEKALGVNDANYASSLNNLAEVYKYMGRFAEAEPLCKRAVNILKKAEGDDHPDYPTCINNLAYLYYNMGRYREAELLYMQVRDIMKKTLREDHPSYAVLLNNLALLYKDMGRYAEAEPLFIQSLSIRKKTAGENNPKYGIALNNLGELYRSMNRYADAVPLLMKAMDIFKNFFGEDHHGYATSINHLALTYRDMGKYADAEPLSVQASNIVKKNLGENHPDYAKALINLALLYKETGRYAQTKPLFAQALSITRKNIMQTFSSLSEKEQSQFLQIFNSNFRTYQSFSKIYPSASSLGYDIALLEKGLLLENSRSASKRILESSDTSLINTYDRFLGARKFLSTQYSKPVQKRLPELSEREKEANELEKQMIAKASLLRLPGFKDYGAAFRVTWEDVQKQLTAGEIAIEFCNFRFYDRKPADSIFYCAYLIMPKDTLPRQIFLFEEKQLDSIVSAANTAQDFATVQNLYTRGVSLEANSNFYGKELYGMVWEKIEPHLKGVNTIYYSPSGKLNKISFAAIPMNEKQLLSDKYNLVSLSSTRELMSEEPPFRFSDNNTIALFGGIQYDMDTIAMKESSAKYQSDESQLHASRSLPDDAERGGTFNYLGGTLEEVEEIQKMFSNNQTFTKAAATEEALKLLQADNAPDVLHIATHGFFYKEKDVNKDEEGANVFENANDPLLRSGLALAGGNRKWQGESVPEGVEDGILTGKEVSAMNLNNTKLVVLSACETGLGDIKGSEGVYGLQRAFKAAGVDYLMMSLWQVPDKETQDFMTAFYKHCKKGSDIQTAFHFTQSEMKRKYKDPYKWAAFVLLR